MLFLNYRENYSPVPNNGGGVLISRGGGVPTDNLKINKREVQIKGRAGLKYVLGQKWQSDLPDLAVTILYKTKKFRFTL